MDKERCNRQVNNGQVNNSTDNSIFIIVKQTNRQRNNDEKKGKRVDYARPTDVGFHTDMFTLRSRDISILHFN